MFKKKTPNYLKFILITFAILFVVIGLLSVFSTSQSEIRKLEFDSKISNLKIPPEIESGNFISYIKQQILTSPQLTNDSPVLGNKNADITIYEFSCFDCPSSRQVQPVLKSVLDKYPDQVRLVWKDLLIPDLYPDAEILHVAARCAQKQDAFWSYHNALWQENDLDKNDLVNIAKDLGLDKPSFESCLENKEILEIIQNDVDEAGELSIPGTPHFYINDQEISGQATFEDFDKIIQIELNK